MNNVEIKTYLEKILNSKTFSLSGVYKRLLKYLTEATLRGEKPKEFTIGLEVFGYEVDDPSTSRVRVSIHKLRKRLEEYYKVEGTDDLIFFTIPKGGYSLEFVYNKEITHKNQHKNILLVLMALALILLSGLVIYLLKGSDYNKLKKTAFWEELLNNKNKTIIIAGDFFMYRDAKYEREHERYLNVRDIQINSKEQLQEYLQSDTNLKREDYIILKDVTYMPRDALYSMKYISPLLYDNNINYQIILSSDFNWETYKDYNLIYIGAFKNLKSLSILTDKLKIKHDHLDQSLTVTDQNGTKVYSSSFLSNKNIDYTLVSKLPGSNNNVIYLFVSDNDIGCMEAVKRFTQIDSLKHFEKNILKDANFFKAIYKAEGIVRTRVTYNMVEFEAITDSTLINFWHY